MVHCLQVWRVYLLGTRFVVRTDNVANTFFKMQKKMNPKQARWQEFLAEYDFVWEHKPGKHNQVADAISRKEVFVAVSSISKLKMISMIESGYVLQMIHFMLNGWVKCKMVQ